MANRKKATDFFLKHIKAINPKSTNVAMYEEYLNGLSDKQFGRLMEWLREGIQTLPYYYRNLDKERIDLNKIIDLLEGLGVELFERLDRVDPVTGVEYTTPERYAIMRLPVRRQKQHVVHGKSVAEHSKHVDITTGQVTGVSQTSAITIPELMILDAAGMEEALTEFLKVRGGDNTAMKAARRQTIDGGGYTLRSIEALNSRPTSTETLRATLTAMHLENNV